MTEVVRKRDGLDQVAVQSQRTGNVARDGGDFNRMRQAGAQVVAGAVQKDLRLVFEPAEGPGMDDPVAVALVMRAPCRWRFAVLAAARVPAELGLGRQNLPLDRKSVV